MWYSTNASLRAGLPRAPAAEPGGQRCEGWVFGIVRAAQRANHGGGAWGLHAPRRRVGCHRAVNPSVPADTPACVLSELRVENLLLIERAELELAPGLNVLTGETGAGKTVLAHALDLLLGGRARAGIVRPGASEAYVEGTFTSSPGLLAHRSRGTLASGEHPRFGQRGGELLGELLAQDAEEVVLARRVGADGRTRAYLNGRTVAVADLRTIGEALLSFYGQHEHRKLTLAAAQLEILDGFTGPEQAGRRAACATGYREVRELSEQLEGLRELDGARERELDLLEHELAEIDAVAPQEGERERLRAERERLRCLDALLAAAAGAAEALAGGQGYDGGSDAPGAMALAAGAAARLDPLAGVDPALGALAERAHALAIETGDLAGELRDYGERLEGEAAGAGEPGDHPARGLQAVEERLAALERLLRKHGPTVAAVLEHAELARGRREQLVGAAVAIEEVGGRLQAARDTLEERVRELRAARAAAAPRLAKAVREQLAALAMPDAAFAVELSPREPGPAGGDTVELMIAPNPGVPAAPLREIASGGELSRVMLALMTVANSGSEATLVFDEVDAGIGGHTARAVGERLRELAGTRQVVCITHLPQIASLAARHFTVVKDATAGSTSTRVERLGEPEVLSELVRMLGAPERDPSARRHARELRKAA
jgi:DNA repair protein RecN (Recombination protein N)